MQNFSLDQLLNSNEPVYVVNNTDPKALLICTVIDPLSGKSHTLEFKRTFIPYCLHDFLPRETLSKSMQIRQYLQKGLLKIIPVKDALAILNSPDGQLEWQRIHQSQFIRGAAMTDQRQAMLDAEQNSRQALANAGVNSGIDTSRLNLHTKIKTWETRVLADELDGAALLSELRIHSTEFTADDLRYMLMGQFPQEAKDFASKALAEEKYKKNRTPTTTASAPALGSAFAGAGYERKASKDDDAYEVETI